MPVAVGIADPCDAEFFKKILDETGFVP